MKRQKQQQKLEALIHDLERELFEGKSQAAALEETHECLRETERICQDLTDENRRLGEAITGWQERLAANEANQRQVSLLRQQLDALQAEQARVTGRNRQMEEKLTDRRGAGRISSPVEADCADAKVLQSRTDMVEEFAPELAGSDEAGGHSLRSLAISSSV
jgi:chromosome segregation ATPase